MIEVRLVRAARMEWIKLLSLRSTWWTLAVTAGGTVGIGVAVGLNSRNASEDLTNDALAGSWRRGCRAGATAGREVS